MTVCREDLDDGRVDLSDVIDLRHGAMKPRIPV